MSSTDASPSQNSAMYDQKLFFDTYFKRATEKPILIERLARRMEPSAGNCALSLVDIGAHDGSLLSRLLEVVALKFGSVNAVAVEPSKAAVERLLAREFPSNCNISGHAKTAEEFFSGNSFSFDWAVASHCFYWSPDLAAVLNPLKTLARKSVVVLRGDIGIFQIQSRFRHLLGNPSEQLYKADDVAANLDKLGIRYEKEKVQTEIEIPELTDIRFRWLTAFFLQTLSEKLTEQDLKEIYEFLNPVNNRIRHDVEFFWISQETTGE